MDTFDNYSTYKKVRHCGIDLLRIIAILLICFSHANQTMRDIVVFPRYNFENGIVYFFNNLGTIGNILFIISSSYFLVDKPKSNGQKVVNILMDTFFISIIILVGFLVLGYKLDWETIVHQFFPNIFQLNWFIPCYILFYILSPLMVYALSCLSKKSHFVLVLGSLIIYGCLSIFNLAPVGSYLLQFFYILNIVAFIKWHVPSLFRRTKLNLLVFMFGMILTYGLYIGFIFLRPYNAFFERFCFFSLYSPLLVFSLIALFGLFENMKFQNKFVSYLSTCSLFVYVIHENDLLRSIIRPMYYEYMITNFGENLALVYMLICGLFMFIAGFVLSVIYKETLHRITVAASNKIYNLLKKVFNSFYNKIFKNA